MSPEQPRPLDVVTETREETLNAYRAKPRQIRSDGKGEVKERREYAKRPILELLQNVEDALSDDERQGGVYIRIDDGDLVVANEGAPFTDRGFRALCTLNDSAKQAEMDRERPPRMIGSKGTGFKSVLNWTDRIELFSGPIVARFDRQEAAPLIRHTIGEAGVAKIQEDGPWPDDRMPLLQVPLSPDPDTPPDAEIQGLLSEHWSTIFRFRLLPDKRADVHTALANIDPRQWLFLDKLSRIEVCVDGVPTDWRLDRREYRICSDNTRCYQLYISKDGQRVGHYQVMRRPLPDSVRPTQSDEVGLAEVGFAYQVDGENDESDARVANFFATDCASPFPAIAVHGTFLLKADRSRLAEDDPSYQGALTNALCSLLRERLIPCLVSQNGAGALEYLAPRLGKSTGETDGVEADLQKRLVDEVKSTAFVRTIGGSVAAPQDLKLWNHGLGKLLEASPAGPEIPRLPHPDWCNDDTRLILRHLGSKVLTQREHVEALQGWQPKSVDAASDAFSLLDAAYESISLTHGWRDAEEERKRYVERARRLTIWRDASGGYLALTGTNDTGGLFEARKDRPTLPKFVRVNWLDSEFQQLLKSKGLWDCQVSSVLRDGRLHKGGQHELLEHAVLPSLGHSSEWWAATGDDVLLALHALECEGDESSDSYESKLRERLAEKCRVPTRDGDWQPASQVYAGADWDNPWAERFVVRSDSERFLLAAPDRLPYGKDFSPVLRFIGVSWRPKWRRHRDESDSYWNWPEDPALLGSLPEEFSRIDGWPDYWLTVGRIELEKDNQRAGTSAVGRWPLVEAWAVEGLEDFIAGFEGVAARVRALRDLWEAKAHCSRRNIVVGRRGPQGGKIRKIGKFESDPLGGFIAWQIKTSRLFSVQPSPFFPDGKAALSDLLVDSRSREAWLKWIPRLRLVGCDPLEESALKTFALNFGAKARVNAYSPEQWRSWLSRLPDWRFEEPPIKELRGFLRDLGERDAKADDWASDTRLPCENTDETLVFSSVRELTILDEPRFDVFKCALLKAGHSVLLASVTDGRRLMERFGCEDRAVSALVRLDVAEHRPCASAQDRLLWCSRVRPLILAWFDHAGGERAAERLRDGWPREIQAHQPLQVNVALAAGGTLGCVDQPFLWEGDILHVDAGDAARLWDHVAEGFKQRSALDKPVEDGVVRLLQEVETAKSPEAGRKFLEDKGIAPEEAQRWEQESPISPDPETAPNQSPLPEILPVPDLEPGADAITGILMGTHPPKAPSQTPGDSDDQLSITQTETPRGPLKQAIPGARTGPDSTTHAMLRPSQAADPGTGSTPVPFPAAPKAPQAPTPSQPDGQARQRQGQEAEMWLKARLKDLIGDTCQIERRRDDVGETDLVIFADGKDMLHIEVKLMTNKSIYWSFGEISKAKSCAERNIPYALAILIPNQSEAADAEAGDLSYQIKWIPEPVRQLSCRWTEGRVSGEWRWSKVKVPAQTLQTLAVWTPSAAPTAAAQGITFVVELGDGDYAGEGLDYVQSLIEAKFE